MSQFKVVSVKDQVKKKLSEYLVKNTPLVRYIRTPVGFVCGVVVAIGRDQIGWSMVSPKNDTELRWLKPHQLPAIQMLTEKAYRENTFFDITTCDAYRNWVVNKGFFNVPKFDKITGLTIAIESAHWGLVKVEDNGTIIGKVPTSPIMVNALVDMVQRSRRVVRFQK